MRNPLLRPVLRRVAPVLTAATLCALAPTARADQYPQLGFANRPDYLDAKEVVLTFDDGPAWGDDTAHVLDVLKQRGVKATFFINSKDNIATSWESWGKAKVAVERIIAEGHELASHTRSHPHLPGLDDGAVRDEIFGVQDEVDRFLDHVPRISLFRAPYGEPYQWKFQGDPQGDASYDRIAGIASERMVHIGWNIDSDDWMCPNDAGTGGQCLFNNIKAKLEAGDYGVILMHSITPRTAAGLPLLLDYLASHGYRITTTEQAVCNAFGATSANLVDGVSGCESTTPNNPGGDGDDGTGDGNSGGDADDDGGDADDDGGDADDDGGDADDDSGDADDDGGDADDDGGDADDDGGDADDDGADADDDGGDADDDGADADDDGADADDDGADADDDSGDADDDSGDADDDGGDADDDSGDADDDGGDADDDSGDADDDSGDADDDSGDADDDSGDADDDSTDGSDGEPQEVSVVRETSGCSVQPGAGGNWSLMLAGLSAMAFLRRRRR